MQDETGIIPLKINLLVRAEVCAKNVDYCLLLSYNKFIIDM